MGEDFIGAGWAFPLRTDATGGVALVAREREIEEAIRLILGTAPGRAADAARVRLPDPRLRVRPGQRRHRRADRLRRPVGAGALGAADRRRRRRGVSFDAADSGTLYIDIRYRIRGTNDPRNLVFPFYVIPSTSRPQSHGSAPRLAAGRELTMVLPAPNLDDRRFQDLVDDAKRLVQQRCPEWTDHNVSDPGVTLIEAFAQMVDQLIYRLNRVPTATTSSSSS